MKLLSSYVKEMTIAFRGFYFYIEIFVAVVILVVLLAAVKENPESSRKEYLFYDMPSEVVEKILSQGIADGKMVELKDTSFTLKPASFTVLNRDTGETVAYDFDGRKTVQARTFRTINLKTGQTASTLYLLPGEEDALRLSLETGSIGATIYLSGKGALSYRYMLQGYETERLSNLLYISHTLPPSVVEAEFDRQEVRELGTYEHLNSRQNLLPVMVSFMGSLMGFFIVISYIFLDKSQGVIKAFAVTPSSVLVYLLSKTMVILTTVVISSSIFVIPVMKLQPDYLMFYLFLLTTTFAFSTLGLLIASFFDSMQKVFGVLYLVMIVLMVPAFSYFISSFDPVWVRFFPTYPVLQVFREILLGKPDVSSVLVVSAGYLLGGIVLLLLADLKFKKTLTV